MLTLSRMKIDIDSPATLRRRTPACRREGHWTRRCDRQTCVIGRKTAARPVRQMRIAKQASTMETNLTTAGPPDTVTLVSARAFRGPAVRAIGTVSYWNRLDRSRLTASHSVNQSAPSGRDDIGGRIDGPIGGAGARTRRSCGSSDRCGRSCRPLAPQTKLRYPDPSRFRTDWRVTSEASVLPVTIRSRNPTDGIPAGLLHSANHIAPSGRR